jgi:hypothetical protein
MYCGHLDAEVQMLRDQLEQLQLGYQALQEENDQLREQMVPIGGRQHAADSAAGVDDSSKGAAVELHGGIHPHHRKGRPPPGNNVLIRVDPGRRKTVVPPEQQLYSKAHEVLRRRLHNDIMELYFYLTSSSVQNRLAGEQKTRLKDQVFAFVYRIVYIVKIA